MSSKFDDEREIADALSRPPDALENEIMVVIASMTPAEREELARLQGMSSADLDAMVAMWKEALQ